VPNDLATDLLGLADDQHAIQRCQYEDQILRGTSRQFDHQCLAVTQSNLPKRTAQIQLNKHQF
jgi:hypothetical protein